MEHRTVLSDIDAVTTKHGITKRKDLGLIRQFKKLIESLFINQILGQIDVQVPDFLRPLLGALWVLLEPATQIGVERFCMLIQCCPNGGCRRVNCAHRAFS